MTASQTTGVLNILKPAGPTSHDVVADVRRVFHQRHVGHAGTLDPSARGVLLVGLGRATRVLEYLGELPKTYRARIVLGISTDTHDADGAITHRAPWKHINWETVRDAVETFRGNILQTPPMYAALKRDGRPLYELARQGISVPRKARPVRIHRTVVLSWQPPHLELEITCSRGTYIRSLARDLGDVLGTGACVESLVRTAIGEHDLRRAVSLSALTALSQAFAKEHVMSMRTALAHLPAIHVGPSEAQKIRHGQPLQLDAPPPREPALAIDERGDVLAILVRREGDTWHPTKVLMPATGA
ncbi:MAG: tRNA pseudouridine(55) synthase TruB [Anaerolineae bacterium]